MATGQIWPVYPEIARLHSIGETAMTFALGKNFARPAPDLDALIDASFRIYEQVVPACSQSRGSAREGRYRALASHVTLPLPKHGNHSNPGRGG